MPSDSHMHVRNVRNVSFFGKFWVHTKRSPRSFLKKGNNCIQEVELLHNDGIHEIYTTVQDHGNLMIHDAWGEVQLNDSF